MRKKQKQILVGIIVIGIILFIVAYQGGFKSLSVISVSSVPFEQGGKVYWVVSSVGDSIDEGFSFTNKPADYTKTDGTGTIVKPQKAMTIYFTKQDSKCEYVLYKTSLPVLYGLLNPEYYLLNNPNRIASIKVRDGNGKEVILNGAVNGDTKTITDSDGVGSVVIKSIGLISSSQDCPNYENVVVIKDGNGNPKIVNRGEYETKLRSITGVWNLFGLYNYIFGQVNVNAQFTSGFDGIPSVNFNTGRLVGNIEIGSGLFTITADQDYYNSVLYIPPKQAKPQIDNILVNTMKVGSTSSVKVEISNDGDTGIVLLKATSTNSGITPSSTQFTLTETASKFFTLTSSTQSGSGEVCFEVCSTGQFETADCDSSCETFSITSDNPPSSCGDGVCQSNENDATCPQDCYNPLICPSGQTKCADGICRETCGSGKCTSCAEWFTSLFKSAENKCESTNLIETKWYNPLTWINFTSLTRQSLWCPIVLGTVAIIFIFSFLLGLEIFESFKYLRGRDKKWYRFLISIAIALILSYLVYATFLIGVIAFIIYLIIKNSFIGRGYNLIRRFKK
jgi:hypothetical protein